MYKEIIHIYGPIAIQSYGFCIAVGLYLTIFLMQRHPQFKKLRVENHLSSLLFVSVFSGLLGGRILYTISHPTDIGSVLDFFAYWHGGFSVLGCVIALCVMLPVWLFICKIPILQFLDLLAIYAPLLQSISRIGCLCAGCCYGLPCQLPWAIKYHDSLSIAPLGVYLHPTQLYSSILLGAIFCLMYWIFQYRYTKPGQLLALYLFLSNAERFTVDFWRNDRIFPSYAGTAFSIHQWVALGIMLCSTLLFMYCSSVRVQTDNRARV